MDLDIPKSIEAIAALERAKVARVGQVAIADRKFLIDQVTGTISEIRPRFEDTEPRMVDVTVRDIDSLIAWCNALTAVAPPDPMEGGEPAISAPIPGGIVTIGVGREKGRGTMAIWPAIEAPHIKRARADAAFFDAYHPPEGWKPLVDFLEWFDLVRPFLIASDVELIDQALQSVTASSGDSTRVEQNGAAISIVTQGERNTTTKHRLPKLIRPHLPIGDPAFACTANITLTVKAEPPSKGAAPEVLVRAQLHPEPVTGSWVAWAREKLQAALPGWQILVGP